MNDMLSPLLYIPATRPDLVEWISGSKPAGKFEIAICMEDAVLREDRHEAARDVVRLLCCPVEGHRPRVWLRPADDDLFGYLASEADLSGIAGIVIPKASPSRIDRWLNSDATRNCRMMPILETGETLHPSGRDDLANACAQYRDRIPITRIGANDIFALMGGLRRPWGCTVYETPVGAIVDALLAQFCFSGMRLSAPVFDRLSDQATFARELTQDVGRGLFCKSVITPDQAMIAWNAYDPTPEEIAEAKAILATGAPAVFKMNGTMHEQACHANWAKGILWRHSRWQASQVADRLAAS